jgi:lipopolysaccharide export system permease protein
MLFHSSIRKELARSFGATLIVLVTVVMTITLIRTLGQASRGSFNPSDVMLVMGYNVLTFLPNIMTMGLFISTVATLSRLYTDSEMVIWFSSGVGLTSLLRPLLRFSWPILLGVATLALFVLPWANQQIEDIKSQYESRGDLDRVQPGQFQESAGGSRVFFVEKNLVSPNIASNVFVATTEGGKETITSARRGRTEIIGNDRFLILENGQRLENTIGKTDLKISEFGQYSILVAQDALGAKTEIPLGTVPTVRLIRNPSQYGESYSWGEISWRIGFVLSALNLMVIALAATRVNPRVSRSGNLFFSLLLFQVYLNLLTLGQNWISSGKIGFIAFNVLLHGGALGAGLLWLAKRQFNWDWRLNFRRFMPRQGKPTP